MKKILVTHPSFNVFGGAERVALRIADALSAADGVDVTLATAESPPAGLVSNYLGYEPKFKLLPIGKSASRVQPSGASSGKSHIPALVSISNFHKACLPLVKQFDVCISAYNEQDFGKPSFQYVHHPLFIPREVLSRYEIVDPHSVFAKSTLLDHLYRRYLDYLAQRNWGRILSTPTMTNSRFMATILEENGFSNVEVLYPGFLDETDPGGSITPSVSREPQVVFLGRFEKDKRVLETIRLMEALHKESPGLNFLLCGSTASPDYLKEIEEALSKSPAPIGLAKDLPRAQVEALLSESLFYINAKPFEHFGMATVEAIQLGCIPLLHKSGSHPEIIGQEPVLFQDAKDLIRVVNRIREDLKQAGKMQERLRKSMGRFKLSTFSDRLREIVQV